MCVDLVLIAGHHQRHIILYQLLKVQMLTLMRYTTILYMVFNYLGIIYIYIYIIYIIYYKYCLSINIVSINKFL